MVTSNTQTRTPFYVHDSHPVRVLRCLEERKSLDYSRGSRFSTTAVLANIKTTLTVCKHAVERPVPKYHHDTAGLLVFDRELGIMEREALSRKASTSSLPKSLMARVEYHQYAHNAHTLHDEDSSIRLME